MTHFDFDENGRYLPFFLFCLSAVLLTILNMQAQPG